jgi:site-specific DNA recombinase
MAGARRNLAIARSAPAGPIRCAIYTRKSTDEGLEKDFNSLDNQREAAEAFVKSQHNEGWQALAERYDDGGFSGGTAERPALKRLLADIGAASVDCVVVYKYDRLSRSMLDFLQMLRFFEQHSVAFVSVTQQFNTTTPVGRMTMNILASFGEFERDIISERTRDKMHAARRRGKWTGGMQVLGYDVAPEGGRLVVNKDEAAQVRAIFDLYLEKRSLMAVVQELNCRGWRRKSWRTREGRWREGKRWDIANLRRVLRDPNYTGMARLADQVFPGEHEGIVPKRVFAAVQEAMMENRRTGGATFRNRHGALLRGLLRCAACDAAMVHTWARKKGRIYRYYTCSAAQKRGPDTCPTRSVCAQAVEAFVIEKIRAIGSDPRLRRETFRQALAQVAAQRRSLKAEEKRLRDQVPKTRAEVDRLVRAVAASPHPQVAGALHDGLASAQERLVALEGRLREVRAQAGTLERLHLDEADLGRALQSFTPIWDVLHAPERERVLRLVFEQISYHGGSETMAFSFCLAGLGALAEEAGAEGRSQ